MEKKWRRIGKGETIPTSSIIRPINGGLPNITGSRVMMGQDCYYLSVDDAYELLKGLPLETEAETKERNDATIIKKLIGLVKETEFLSEENRATLLDWIEKQGEQKPAWGEEEKKKLDRIYYILGIAADEHAYSNTCRLIGDKEAVELQDFLRSIAKQEQKPVEDVNGEDYGIDSLWHAHRILEKTLGKVEGYQSDDGILEHECAISAVKKLYEQNSVWSEEDEELRALAIENLSELKQRYGEDYGKVGKCIDLLENIKNRILPIQPQREWSEESKKMLDAIYSCVDSHYDGLAKTSLLIWLKSIRPQNGWKPSDEQIYWLKWAVNRMPDTEKANEAEVVLGELLEQLKKL